MPDTKRKTSQWKRRLVAELKRDKKKTVVMLALFVVVLIVVAVRIIGNDGPTRARAAVAPTVVPSTPAPQGPSPMVNIEPMQHAEDAPNDDYIKRVDRTIRRDIFVPDLDQFPPQEPAAEVKPVVTTTPSVDEEETKVRGVIAQAQALVLQSTILCQDPTAVINGKVLYIGNQISGFEIVEIRARSCDVRKDGVTITLSMKE
jgi:hypothetical protein